MRREHALGLLALMMMSAGLAAAPCDGLTVEAALGQLAKGPGEEASGPLAALECRARDGSGEAARVLGALHMEGHLVAPDLERGLAWVDWAIQSGDVPAMLYKAELAERGLGLPLDLVAARDLYRRAAEAGSVEAAARLGRALADRGKVEAAERWLRVAVEAEHPGAGVDLGVLLYRAGDRDEEAVDWFHRAARTGDPDGLYNLAVCLLEGRGLIADRGLATGYLEEAAAAGSRAAREALDILAATVPSEARTD